MDGTKIEWAHDTFSPWWGCVKVSPACEHCYAESFAKRVGQKVWGPTAPRRFFGDKHWAEPLKWNKQAAASGQPRRVFCSSMADVCEDREDLAEPRLRLIQLILDTPALTWMLLTKRPENVRRMFWAYNIPPNVWLMTTAEDQQRANERIRHITCLSAAVVGLSCEPLLGPISLADAVPGGDIASLSWVICGGESGPKARPMHPEWARSLRDQCQAAGVPFFFKQWGEYAPDQRQPFPVVKQIGRVSVVETVHLFEKMIRVGKKAAGRILDGRTWDEFPAL